MLSSSKSKVSLDLPNSHTVVLEVPATPGQFKAKDKDKEGGATSPCTGGLGG